MYNQTKVKKLVDEGSTQMTSSIVASNLKKIIAEQGYKKCAVAKMAGYTEKSFSNMLNGRKLITDLDIIALSNALKVSPNTLFATENANEESDEL